MIISVCDVPDLNHDSPEALWSQLAAVLRQQIADGTLTGRLPSARALATSWHVSRETVVRAMAALRDEGLITTVHGRGTFTAG